MAKSFQCDIVSVEASLFSGKVSQVMATGAEGEIGILAGHEPLLTRVASGPVEVTLEDGKKETFFASGGILEVQPDSVSILADTAERGGDLDEAAAQRALEQARSAMADKQSELDYSTALGGIAEATARLRALQRVRNNR
ncbi:F0F1 ATP synthase subunit epsilon [Carnimonas nigrificans]|uniref:F0F1 ATP synthase subunit epsilon n=1 Tax=Carnimonas nigrificans TaxID=64323 RepID=UPI000472B39B|nr:F0F1 ATP synthase subunit epsilon [Carnimonas nigrificans]